MIFRVNLTRFFPAVLLARQRREGWPLFRFLSNL
jgi:hypothetical protein